MCVSTLYPYATQCEVITKRVQMFCKMYLKFTSNRPRAPTGLGPFSIFVQSQKMIATIEYVHSSTVFAFAATCVFWRIQAFPLLNIKGLAYSTRIKAGTQNPIATWEKTEVENLLRHRNTLPDLH